MTHVVFIGEGQTEETFTADVLRPALLGCGVYIEPRLIPTSRYGRGGALKRDRVLSYLRHTLRERTDTYVTTFFDLYSLAGDFPGMQAASAVSDPIERAGAIQRHFATDVVAEAGCRPDRFIAHVQPYEFESLLFSDVAKFADLEPSWERHVGALESARSSFSTPEYINDGSTTHPSARLEAVLSSPRYRKVLHGSLLAEHIGLSRMRSECAHFHGWLSSLEALGVSTGA